MQTWTPVQKLSIGAGSALLVLSLFGIVAFLAISHLATQRQEVREVNETIGRLDQLLASSADAERAGTDFMMTGAHDASEAFDQARGRVEDALDMLRQRVEDRPRQRAALDTLGPLLGTRFATLSAGIATRQRKGPEAAAAFVATDMARITRGGILPLVQRMREEELRVLAERTRLQSKNGSLASGVILAGSILALLLAGLAFTPIRGNVAARLTRRLTTPGGTLAIPEFGESLSEASRQAGDRLGRVEQLVYALDKPASAEGVGDALVARGLSNMTAAALVVCRHDGSAWHVVARRSSKATVGSALPADIGKLLDDASANREPMVVETQAERDKIYPGLPSLGATPEVAVVAIPLVANGRTLGGFILAFDEPRVFGDDERAYLATIGRLGGQAIVRIG